MSGQTLLAQFLRMKVAAASLAGSVRVDGKTLRRQLESGGVLDVACYPLARLLRLPALR